MLLAAGAVTVAGHLMAVASAGTVASSGGCYAHMSLTGWGRGGLDCPCVQAFLAFLAFF